MKQVFVLLLALATAFSLCACMEGTAPNAAASQPTENLPEQTAPTDALSALRMEMQPPVIAVADFGCPSLSEDFGIMEYLLEEYPRWMEKHNFIRDIPQQRIVRTCNYDRWAQLLCIVPRDPAATVSVEVIRYMGAESHSQTDVAYHSESGEPILLLADLSESVSISVTVTGSDGRGVCWLPCQKTYQLIPEDASFGAPVMDFSPDSEKTPYAAGLDAGWTAPDEAFLTNHYFHSEYGYGLELLYAPGDGYDGTAAIYEPGESGAYEMTYSGYWQLAASKLLLDMSADSDSSIRFREAFPILQSPDDDENWCIFRTEEGAGLPQFYEDMSADEVVDFHSGPLSPYEYARFQGWEIPDMDDLMGSFRFSDSGYTLELTDDAAPNDGTGTVSICDVGEDGAYTQSYSGTWNYADGMLHLSLVPLHSSGSLIDDSFPVLVLDEALWIGRNDDGLGMPHFYPEQMADILTPIAG